MKVVINSHAVLSQAPEGPIAPYLGMFADALVATGYWARWIHRHVLLAARCATTCDMPRWRPPQSTCTPTRRNGRGNWVPPSPDGCIDPPEKNRLWAYTPF